MFLTFQLVQPSNSFDVGYVRLFRVLDIIRQKLQFSISDQLRTLQVTKEWVLAARLCSPRVLFLFESCLLQPLEDTAAGSNRNKTQVSLCKKSTLQVVVMFLKLFILFSEMYENV